MTTKSPQTIHLYINFFAVNLKVIIMRSFLVSPRKVLSSAWLRWALDANALEPHFGRLESKASTYELFRSPSRMVISRFYSRHTFGQISSKKKAFYLFF